MLAIFGGQVRLPPAPSTMPTIKYTGSKFVIERLITSTRRGSSAPRKSGPSRTRIKLTPTERAAKKTAKDAVKKDYHAALREAQETIRALARQLHERFGGHTVDYYMEEIMQQSRLKGEKKAPSLWNAFVALEVERLNARTSALHHQRCIN